MARSGSAGRAEFREANAARLGLHSLFRSEKAVRFNLVLEGVLLHAAGIAVGLSRPLGIFANRLIERLVWHEEKLSLPILFTFREPQSGVDFLRRFLSHARFRPFFNAESLMRPGFVLTETD